MTFTIAYVALSVGIPAVTFLVCELGRKLLTH
jgi:hypothetical protein